MLGPEAGHEDSPELATGYLPTSKADALGVDDDRLDLVIERLNHAQGALMLGRHSLPIDAGPEDVRLAVAGRLLDEIERDLDITLALTGDLPLQSEISHHSTSRPCAPSSLCSTSASSPRDPCTRGQCAAIAQPPRCSGSS